jgi:hypothetical protein
MSAQTNSGHRPPRLARTLCYNILMESENSRRRRQIQGVLSMTIKDIKEAKKKKTAKKAKVVDIKAVVRKKEAYARQLKKLQEVRAVARTMGIDRRNMSMKELVRAIQRAEGNTDCYMTSRVLTCGETSCCWREECRDSRPRRSGEMELTHSI